MMIIIIITVIVVVIVVVVVVVTVIIIIVIEYVKHRWYKKYGSIFLKWIFKFKWCSNLIEHSVKNTFVI